MEFDQILLKIGQFGKYQIIVFLSICLIKIQTAFNNVGIVMLAGTPKHWCRSPELEAFNLTSDNIKELTIPLLEQDGQMVYSSCARFVQPYQNWTAEDVDEYMKLEPRNGSTEYCPHGWEYDTSIYTSTVVSQWNLVCDDYWLKAVGSSVYMAGLSAGVLFNTGLADIIGRRPILITAVPLTIAAHIAQSFSPNYITFCVLRFFVGFLGFGGFTCAFVLVLELIGPDYRMHAGIAVEYAWATGYLTFAGIAYFARDWHMLNLVASCIFIPVLFTLILIPESPRWLYVHGKKDAADKIVKRIAKINNVQLDDKFTVTIKNDKKGYIWDLFRTPRMACRSVNLCFIWFVTSCVYYGLSLNTSNLGGNDHLNFAIAAAVEFPAYLLSQIALHYVGRRIPLCVSLIIGGVSLLCLLAVPKEMGWLQIALPMFGKFGITAAFGIIYVFTAELYPTTVRSIGVGTSSFSARIGGIIAPFIAELSVISKVIPMVTMGVMSLLAGFLSLILTETRGRSLPETLEDGENFGRNIKMEIEVEVENGSVFCNQSFTGDDDNSSKL